MIRRTDRIHAVLARDERLLEVLASAAPAFEKLRHPALRRTMARLVTVEQAARIGGLDPDALLARLNEAIGITTPASPDDTPAPPQPAEPEGESIPPALLAIPPERIVDADVREDLRKGIEPFRRIMDAARATPPDGVLRVRAIFEPAPLYGVLGRQGFRHFAEKLASDDWRVWFFRGEATTSDDRVPVATNDDPSLELIDVRGLEPPEPMMRTLEALAALPRGRTLVQVNVRVPQFLLPKLEERGFTWEVHEQSEDLVRIFIRHKNP